MGHVKPIGLTPIRSIVNHSERNHSDLNESADYAGFIPADELGYNSVEKIVDVRSVAPKLLMT